MQAAPYRYLARNVARTAQRRLINTATSRRGLATVTEPAPKVLTDPHHPNSLFVSGTDLRQDPVDFDQITTLSNGLRVATEDLPGPFSAVGVYVDAGSRYENEDLCGVSHINDRLAFKVRRGIIVAASKT